MTPDASSSAVAADTGSESGTAVDPGHDLTVVYVAYGVDAIDLDWIPSGVPVVIVHNDERLEPPRRPGTSSLHPGTNLGFGAGVNHALAVVRTERVVLCNPDTELRPIHFDALAAAPAADAATISLVEPDGTPNAVVSGYWNPVAFVATALRLGRLAPRGSRARRLATVVLGRWGRSHRDALTHRRGTWPLTERWASAAVLALPVDALQAIGGFDDSYFLYYEDADLQQRLARRFPEMSIHLLDVEPAVHQVGGSDTGTSSPVAGHRLEAALVYGRRQPGLAWRAATAFVAIVTGRWP